MPQFIYFDLGNVLLYFDRSRQFRQLGSVLGISSARVARIVEDHDLMVPCETGLLSPREVYQIFCDAAETQCDFEELQFAGSDIFRVNTSILPLLVDLVRTGNRLGILSNTSASHWEFCMRRFPLVVSCFEKVVLSYEVGNMKPDPEIFAAAATAAATQPSEIFYIDDLQKNVDGANASGFDAVCYSSTSSLVTEMSRRGIQISY